MHSNECGEIPVTTPEDAIATRLRAESLALAVVVILVSLAAGIVTMLALAGGFRDLAARSVLALWLGGVIVAGLGVFLVDRHRRVLDAHTERLRELNLALRRSSVRKDEFLASVSHELRTPLNVILGYVDLLLDHAFGPLEPAQRDVLHRITKNAGNLSRLINDLVDLSRIEAGHMRIELEVVDLVALFAELTALMEMLLAGHDVTFDADIASGCHQLRADSDRLKQIISNLLVNAVKFTEHGGITLRAESGASGRVVISVADTGIGIPNVDQHAIFEPFRQVHDREHRAPGAGIGLSISSRLAVLMGGTLSVESTPGKGSRFTLVLGGPLTAEPPDPITRRQGA